MNLLLSNIEKQKESSRSASLPEVEDSMIANKRKGALPPPPPSILSDALGVGHVHTTWLAGDGSDRCYYRIRMDGSSKSYVLMQLSGIDAEALKEGRYHWIEIASLLEKHKIIIPTPKVVLEDYAAIVIEDYGDTMLEKLVRDQQKAPLSDEIKKRYDSAFGILAKFLRLPPEENCIWCDRAFDTERLKWELDFFKEEFLEAVAGWTFSPSEAKKFNEDVASLSSFLGSHAQYFVHRDFHSRNLMVQNGHLAVLDFQDARLGPPAYDLVSLCFDSYVPFSSQQRIELLERGLTSLTDTRLVSRDELDATWPVTLLHRQLKAIGSFGYLTVSKNRGDYLRYVEPALKTLKETDIFDVRWPFLSKDIPEKLIKMLGERPYG